MRVIHSLRGLAVVGATAIALSGIGVGAALADPSSTPSLDTLVGVGSDTLTPLFDNGVPGGQTGSIVPDYNAAGRGFSAASWDAVNPATGGAGDPITLKASGSSDTSCGNPNATPPTVARPNGSGAGINELNKNQTDASKDANGDTVYCVDFARSSRGPNTPTSGNPVVDTFVALGSDAIGWTYPVVSGQTNHQPASLTVSQLQDIYNCRVTTWGQVNGNSSDTTPIVPVIPQAGSGTRATWLAAMGIGSTIPSCVVNGMNGTNPIEENTGDSAGNVAQFTSSTAAEDIFPYSIGDWIAQGSAVTGTGTPGTPDGATVGGHAQPGVWDRANMVQGQVTDDFGTTGDAVTTNSFGQPVINPNWAFELDRTLYAVTRNGGTASNPTLPTTPAYEHNGLTDLFGPSGWYCTSNVGQSDVRSYGFGTPAAGCGTLTPGN